jgi:hypothetical protein
MTNDEIYDVLLTTYEPEQIAGMTESEKIMLADLVISDSIKLARYEEENANDGA